jgi:hypothetical protein
MLSINLTELSFDSSTTYTGRKLRLVVLLLSNAAVNENPLLHKLQLSVSKNEFMEIGNNI